MSDAYSPGAAIAALKQGMALCLGDAELKRRILVSIVVNGLAFMALFGGVLWGGLELVEWALAGEVSANPAWYEELWYMARDGLRWVLYVVVVVAAFFYSPVLFTVLASAILPAFHGPVFSAARARAGGPELETPPTPFTSTLWMESKRLVRFIALSVLILPLNLLPVVGSALYLGVQFFLSAHTLGWDLLAYHFELHGLDASEQRRFIREHRGMVLTLGGGAALLAMIPVLQCLFITTNVASAGLLSAWLDGAPRELVTGEAS